MFKVVMVIVAVLLLVQISKPTSTENVIENQDFIMTQIEPSGGFCSGQFIDAADPDWPFDVYIGGGSYHYYFAERAEDTAMYGSFDSSIGIDFFICDQDNFDLWTSGHIAYVYEISYNVGSLDWEFMAPHDDTWYKMYDNTDNIFTQAHVIGAHRLDTTAPTITHNLDDGDTYSGTKDIIISATDEGFGLYTISLFINDVLTDSEYGDSLTYEWDTSRFDNGDYEIRILAVDRASHSRNVNIDISVSNMPDLTIPILIGASAIIAIMGVVIVSMRRGKEPSSGVHPEMVSYPSQQPPETTPLKQDVAMFCSSCGTPRTLLNARFCSKCGSEFPD